MKVKKSKIVLYILLVFLFGEFLSVSNIYALDKNAQTDKADKDAVLDVLDLKGMEMVDVLKLISQKSGLNIVASQNVKGKVTVYLRNIGVKQALKIIVDAYGWAYAQDGGVIKVMTAQEYEQKYGTKFGEEVHTTIHQLLFANVNDLMPVLNEIKSPSGKVIADGKSSSLILIDTKEKLRDMESIIKRLDVPVKTEVFDIHYADAEELSGKITEMLTDNIGKIRFDARSNTIVVSDTDLALKHIKNVIEAFDKKDPEVLIEAKIIQVILNNHHKMGIDWQAIVSDYHSLTLNSSYSILNSSDKQGNLSIGTIANDDYELLLEALQTVGTTDILSSPRITAINNKEAKILVGSTEPYVTTTTTTPASGPTTTAESVNFIEVGVKLFVTPTIHKDGFITMKIRPEVSSVTSSISTSNNNTIPIVETSEAETTVMVKDGVTIVIGGLMKEENRKTTNKIPVLGDIPLLKYAFQNEDSEKSKTELVIFLTPNIISGDVDEKTSIFSRGVLFDDTY